MKPAAGDRVHDWEIKPSSGGHLDVLDGIRGVAILMVVVFHTFYTNPGAGGLSETVGNLIKSGWMGVPLFFVLSGFLISRPFLKGRRKDLRFWYIDGYARRRIGKILPPFYLSIVVFTAFYWIWLHDTSYFGAALRWATGYEIYKMSTVQFNLSYWSLIVEAHFYLVLPLLFLCTRGFSFRKSAFAIVAVMFLLPLALRQIGWAGRTEVPGTWAGSEMLYFVDRFPFCLLDYFAFGVAFAALHIGLESRERATRKLSIAGYAGMAMLAFTLCFWAYACKHYHVEYQDHRWSLETFHYLSAFSGFLLLFFVFDPQCLASRLLSSAWLRFVGIVSYEWFLFHGPIVSWFREEYGHTNGSLAHYLEKTVLPLALTFVLSVALYRWFSLPIMNRIRATVKKQPASS